MVLSRYFDKTEYGTYKQVFYIYSILLGMFTLGLPNAYSYFLARSPVDQAKSLIWKMTRLFMILGLIMSIFLFFGAGFLSNIMRNPELRKMLMIFAPVPFLMLPTLGLQNILVTFRASNIIPIYVIITSLVQFLCVILPVLIWRLGCSGALIGFNIGSFVAFCLAIYLNTYPIRKEIYDISRDSYRDIFKFALPLFVATIWGTLINSTDQFFISRYFGTEIFADFSNGATDLPFVGMIIGATSAVLTPLFTREINGANDYRDKILPVWNSAFTKSAMLIYPITIFCIFEADNIMSVMYGDLYLQSGSFFRIKLFTYFFKIISFYSLIIALGATKFYQSVHMYEFIGLAIVELIIVNFTSNPILVVGTHVLFTISTCLIFIYYISRKLEVQFLSMFPVAIILKIGLCSVISLVIVYFTSCVILSEMEAIMRLLIDASIFAFVFYIASVLLRLNYFSIVKPLITKYNNQ